MDQAAKAYIRGDLAGYVALFDHADDYTLMPPYGGATQHGFAYDEDRAAAVADFFRSGEATLEVERAYASGDLAVLVAVERQHGEVNGLPEQDWSLRVTLVFRRVADRWQIVHRHADPLVRQIPFDRFARLAGGPSYGPRLSRRRAFRPSRGGGLPTRAATQRQQCPHFGT